MLHRLILVLGCLVTCVASQPIRAQHIDSTETPTTSPDMLNGLRTTVYTVPDLAKAKAWYAEVLGVEPYFDEPYYVGFDVGGFELGLQPSENEAKTGGGVVAYWGVDDVEAARDRLLEHGATLAEEVREVGDGIRLAVVHDPFGNRLGIIENPHFEE